MILDEKAIEINEVPQKAFAIFWFYNEIFLNFRTFPNLREKFLLNFWND